MTTRLSLYIDLCNCLILTCSIQHQTKGKFQDAKQLQALANQLAKNVYTPEDRSQSERMLKKPSGEAALNAEVTNDTG